MSLRRVCLISTVNHNVGDDFVREGILWLLRQINRDFRADVLHKHFPPGVRGPAWERMGMQVGKLPLSATMRGRLCRMLDALPLDVSRDRLLRSDLVVQCGAPVYWANSWSSCADTEWFDPLIQRRWTKIRDSAPLLNLGAGSCLRLGSDGSEVSGDRRCREFIERFTECSSLTIVRDRLAQTVLQRLGFSVPLLPCPSIFAPRAASVEPREGEGEYVALNFMPGGGHYAFSTESSRAWEDLFVRKVRDLAQKDSCLLVCHDLQEERAATHLLPEVPRFRSEDWREYLKVYARCRYAVVNRVHGAMAAAALGKPALLIGNDSRMLTAEGIPGIHALPVTASSALLSAAWENVALRSGTCGTNDFVERSAQAWLEQLGKVLS